MHRRIDVAPSMMKDVPDASGGPHLGRASESHSFILMHYKYIYAYMSLIRCLNASHYEGLHLRGILFLCAAITKKAYRSTPPLVPATRTDRQARQHTAGHVGNIRVIFGHILPTTGQTTVACILHKLVLHASAPASNFGWCDQHRADDRGGDNGGPKNNYACIDRMNISFRAGRHKNSLCSKRKL